MQAAESGTGACLRHLSWPERRMGEPSACQAGSPVAGQICQWACTRKPSCGGLGSCVQCLQRMLQKCVCISCCLQAITAQQGAGWLQCVPNASQWSARDGFDTFTSAATLVRIWSQVSDLLLVCCSLATHCRTLVRPESECMRQICPAAALQSSMRRQACISSALDLCLQLACRLP